MHSGYVPGDVVGSKFEIQCSILRPGGVMPRPDAEPRTYNLELSRWSTAAPENQRYNKKHQENHEQDVGNPRGFSRYAAQPEGLGDKGDD
jgi:hypothetical protein